MILETNRVILKTYDGQVVVRPECPGYIKLGDKLELWFNNDGIAAWNAGEDVIFPDHVSAMGDVRGLIRADFK